MRGRVRVGISGFRYAPWRGVFYPPKLRQRDELAFASRLFDTLELNGSFYSLLRPTSYRNFYEQAPDDFVFAVKGSRYITHMRKIRDVSGALANFFASGVLLLEEKLGPFLWQFPESMRCGDARFEEFFAMLPKDSEAAERLAATHAPWMRERSVTRMRTKRALRHAIEIRSPSCAVPEFVALVRRYGLALVIADSAGRFPRLEDLTADFVYLRLHGDEKLYESGYSHAALARWAERIRAYGEGKTPRGATLAAPAQKPQRGPRDVYVYFDNDAKVHAPFDAAELARLLGTRRVSMERYGPMPDARSAE